MLESLQEEYGSTFEGMTQREKLFLIFAIAAQLCDQEPGRCRDEIYVVGHQINSSLPKHDKEGLIEALINQARAGVEVRLVGHKELRNYRGNHLALPDKDDDADALALACVTTSITTPYRVDLSKFARSLLSKSGN